MSADSDRINALLEEVAHLTRVLDRCIAERARAHGVSERAVRHDLGLTPPQRQWAEDSQRAAR